MALGLFISRVLRESS